MAWDLIYWLICFCLDIALFASSLYQYVMLTDLEADYINPFELSSRINQLVVPEFIVHGVFCALFLLAQRWFMFLFTVPLTYYIVMLFVKQKHLIDVTEVFRVVNTEKKCRLVKLGVYFCLLAIIIIRCATFVIVLFSFMGRADCYTLVSCNAWVCHRVMASPVHAANAAMPGGWGYYKDQTQV